MTNGYWYEKLWYKTFFFNKATEELIRWTHPELAGRAQKIFEQRKSPAKSLDTVIKEASVSKGPQKAKRW